MRKFIFIILVFVHINSINCQQNYFNELYPTNIWGNCIGLLHKNDTIYACTIDKSPLTGLQQLKFLVIEKSGELISTQTISYPNGKMFPGRSQAFNHTSDGGFSVCAVIETSSGFSSYLLKLNKNLEKEWMTIYEGVNKGLIIDGGIQTEDKGFVMTGEEHLGGLDFDVIVIKVDSLGNEEWRRLYGNDEPAERGYGISISPDKGYVISGYSFIPTQAYSGEGFVLKIDSAGHEEWYKTFGNDTLDDSFSITTTSNDGNIAMGMGYATFQVHQHWVADTKIKLFKLSLSGDILWERTYWESFNFNLPHAVKVLDDGSIVATGHAWCDFVWGGTHSWILKANSYGDSIWFKKYSYYENVNSPQNNMYEIEVCNDGGFIVGGEAHRTNPGGGYPKTPWIFRTDSAGCLYSGCDPTINIDELELSTISGLVAYPNPTSDAVTFKYFLKESQYVSLAIYNNIGELIEILIQQEESPGNYNYRWDSDAVSNGMYFAILRSDKGSSMIKFIKQ